MRRAEPEHPDDGLSRRERQIMSILHRRGRATAAEVLDDLPDPPSYSSVRSALRLLESKGAVRHDEDGPRYVFYPATPRSRARRSALDHVLRTFFGGSRERAVAALLEDDDLALDDAEYQRLTALLADARRRGEGA